MTKGRKGGGRPSLPRDEPLTETICFRTTTAVKAQAEQIAKAEGRTVSNLIQRLIRDRYQEGLDRVAPYPSARRGRPATEFDVA
jgi:hypothetical protein